MSGVAIVRYLLSVNGPLIASVPAAKIMAGVLPLATALPAISVMEVDGIPRLTVDMSEGVGKRMITERVQVSVLTKTYPSKKQIMALVRAAIPAQNRGIINGVLCDSVLPDSRGPDLDDPDTGIFEQSRDFVVKWFE